MAPLLFAAELSNGDVAIGGGIFVVLAGFSAQLFRRTRDTDERVDDVARMQVELSVAREEKANAERDAALARERAVVERNIRLELELAQCQEARRREHET